MFWGNWRGKPILTSSMELVALVALVVLRRPMQVEEKTKCAKKKDRLWTPAGVECFSFLTCCARGQILQNRCFGTLRPHRVIHGAISALITHKSNCVS